MTSDDSQDIRPDEANRQAGAPGPDQGRAHPGVQDNAHTGPGDVQDTTLVILGASGDLTQRLLLPGLGTLLAVEPERRVRVRGVGRDERSQEKWSELVETSLRESGVSDEAVERILADTSYTVADILDEDQCRQLVESLPDDAVLYFALPPQVSYRMCELLAELDLDLPSGLRLALEKPFGFDAESARDFNALLARLIPEERTFRVDHFLGKSAVLNLLGLRFANRIFEPVWNAVNIERVDILADETLALEGRAGYYDSAGALKDMIQSHLLLVMAMFAMEEVASVDEVELRDLMAHALRATELADTPDTASRRARYTAGEIDGRQIPSYVDEDGVDPDRNTETLAEIDLVLRNSRWAGVPIRLRSGKALGDYRRGITVTFRPVDHAVEGLANVAPQNVLRLGMSPETIHLEIATNGAEDKFDIERTVMESTVGDSHIRPYGEILAMILDGNPLLSVRGDIAEECWRIVSPVLQAWAEDEVPMAEYAAGSSGPQEWS